MGKETSAPQTTFGFSAASTMSFADFSVPASASMLFSSNQGNDDEEGHEFTPDFGPVSKDLPPEIEVKTGEEDEKVLFQERSKLYRLHEDTNQWKERGIGDIKILHH